MDLVLESAQLNVRLKMKGAELCSIKSRNTGVEYMWQAEPAFWAKHAPILFPIVGKLKDDTYFYKGNLYKLPQHGFARDMEFEVIDRSENRMSFMLASSETTKKVYPFDFQLRVGYELKENRLTIKYEVENTGTSQLLYSIGGHPAFRVPLFEKEQRSDYEIRFEKKESVSVYAIKDGLLTGASAPLLQGESVLPISDQLFEHDALVFKELQSEKISISKQNEAPFLNFYFQSPFFGIWSKSAQSPFVCLEPWRGIADSAGHDQQLENKEGVRRLAPETLEVFQFAIEILE